MGNFLLKLLVILIGLLILLNFLKLGEIGTGEVISEKKVKEEIDLGAALISEIDNVLTDDDLSQLQDTELNFKANSYRVHDEVLLDDKAKIATSLTDDEAYGREAVIEVGRKAVKYQYVFDNKINLSEASNSNPIEINFLGEPISIIKADANSLKIKHGRKIKLGVGESVIVDEKNLTLTNIGVESVAVTVDNVFEVFSGSKVVNDIEVVISELFSTSDISEKFAVLYVGGDVIDTYKDGDAYFGEKITDPDWVFYFEDLETNPVIGVEYAQSLNTVVLDGCFYLPNNFMKICLDKFVDNKYRRYDFDEESVDLSKFNLGNKDAYVFDGGSESFKVGNTRAGRLIFVMNDSLLYLLYRGSDTNTIDLGGSYAGAGNDVARTNFDDTELNLDVNVAAATATITINSELTNDDVSIVLNHNGNAFTGLNDLQWNGASVCTKENDLLTKYGIIIDEPECSSNDVMLELPEDQVKARVVIG